MRTYLSIDIDYWAKEYWSNSKLIKISLGDFLSKVSNYALDNNIPILSMRDHHQMLELVDAVTPELLVNVDAHSDLTDESFKDEFNCGTWVKFVKNKTEAVYRWVRPDSPSFWGDCNGYTSPIFAQSGIKKGMSNWNDLEVSSRPKELFDVLSRLSDCVAIGIVTSPEWCDWDNMVEFKKWKQLYPQIPYIKPKWRYSRVEGEL